MADESKLNIDDRAIDMATASVVEFLTDGKGKVWVNVDGLCMLRIGVVTTQIRFTDETGTIIRIADDSQDLAEALGGADELTETEESAVAREEYSVMIDSAEKREGIPDMTPEDECPDCGTMMTVGYGLAGGGMGVYKYCTTCEAVKQKTLESEGE